MQNKITIFKGNVLDRIKEIPDNSIQCCVSSPPYYSLRFYGTEQQIWGGDKECKHNWIEYNRSGMTGGSSEKQDSNRGSRFESSNYYLCSQCGAMKCSLGLEPNVDSFVNHIVEIYEEVKRVLHPFGVCYLNISDSYSGSGGPGSQYDSKNEGYGKTFTKYDNPNRKLDIPAKNLCLVPQRLVIALQENGWIIRSVIIWTKANPMPESVLDRPTTDFEYIFMMVKSNKYFWDKEGVRQSGGGSNLRTTWNIPTQPLSCAVCKVCGKYWHTKPPKEHCGKPVTGHFASFPFALVERCLKSGASIYGCCPLCFSPWERILKPTEEYAKFLGKDLINKKGNDKIDILGKGMSQSKINPSMSASYETIGWQPTCKCVEVEGAKTIKFNDLPFGSVTTSNVSLEWLKMPIPCTILDVFGGSGTSAIVANKLGMDSILIELNSDYINIAKGRIFKECGLLAKVEVK